MTSKTLTTALGALLLAGCASSHKIYHEASNPKIKGIRYALPRTVFTAEFPVTKTTTVTNKLYSIYISNPRLTNAYGAVLPVGVGNTTKFSVDKPIISSRAHPDLNHRYIVKYAGGPFNQRNLSLDLSEMGLLVKGTSVNDNKTVDMTVSTIKTIADIASAVVLAVQDTNELVKISNIGKALKQIRQERQELGKLPTLQTTPLQSIQWLDNRLKSQEQQLRSLMIKSSKTTKNVVVEVDPVGNPSESIDLFYLDAKHGLTNSPSSKIVATIPNEFLTSNAGSVTNAARFDIQEKYDLSQFSQERIHTNRARSFYYRIPALVRLTIAEHSVNGTNEIRKLEQAIPQFGKVVSLPRHFLSRRVEQNIELSENSGALRKVTIATEPFESESIETVGTAITTTIEAERNSEKERLQLEKDLLELRKQIRELRSEE